MYRLSLWFTRFYVLSFDCCAYSLLSISMLFHVSGSEFMHTLISYGLFGRLKFSDLLVVPGHDAYVDCWAASFLSHVSSVVTAVFIYCLL